MINLTRDLKSISYIKAHLAELVDHIQDSKSPVVIMQKGKAKAVLMDMDSYEKTLRAIDVLKVRLSGESAANGNIPLREKAAEGNKASE
ncbi:MAG: type II toxin-antitoxin system Phd/YefM family antitoxin [Spirochaetaceae bacterium]|jgi:prevent-host-death family protein|nr:type II toxin-antitoxin system Phd/YefM family antitoxin [Spirochaetaceae bacterium]